MSVRQRLIIFIFAGLFVTTSIIGAYRYARERESLFETARLQGAETGRMLATLAAPLLLTQDYSALQYLAKSFAQTHDGQEIAIVDAGGHEVVRVARPDLADQRMKLAPFPVLSGQSRVGELRISVYPADLAGRLRSSAASTLFEHFFIFIILAAILALSVARTVTGPVQRLGGTVKTAVDARDFSLRVVAGRNDEIGELSSGVNYLLERLEQFVQEMAAIASRINALSPRIAKDLEDIRENSVQETHTMNQGVAAVQKMVASVRTVADSAEGLSLSAEETSSAILEMNSSNQEVARHSAELASAIEEVTTSVMEMIATIREVADHVENMSAVTEETSASAAQIEASVREVERAAQESARLSQQVSQEAREMGVHAIEETAAAMQRIKRSVSDYSGLVTRLGARSDEIGKILGVIVEVTERTNLLALNASILAAQAGEQGRGFAVVAEEIKALADRTAGSAQDIAKLIASVQKETREAVTAMNTSLDAVDEGVSRSDAAAQALKKIVSSSGRSSETAGLIERAMAEQASGIKRVAEAVSNVKQMMSQIAMATQAQSKGTEMILTAAESMRDIARQVNHAMAEQERGGRQIAEAAEQVTAGAGRIAASTREQGQASSEILAAIERIQDLPRGNAKRMEALAGAVRELKEQAGLLDRELASLATGPKAGGAAK